MAEPYLSIVATARNDNHGGNLLERMQMWIDGIAEQCRRFALHAEIVLVDWNPPAEKPPLAAALRWPAPGEPCESRVISVPAELHRKYEHSDRLPLFQMIAKNVGIRRARAPFVLATNIDLLYSHELMRFLAAKRLRADRMYRVDRLDADAGIPYDLNLDDKLAWCENNLLRINRRASIEDLRARKSYPIYWPMSPRVALLELLQNARIIPTVTRPRLHLNACGDFTLLSREGWAKTRGYPEWQIFSMHLDSVLCTAAHFGGYRELVLQRPMVCYHVEHATGSGWTINGEKALNERLQRAGIPQLAFEEFHKMAVRMRKEREGQIFNNADWGLAKHTLPETTPNHARGAAA